MNMPHFRTFVWLRWRLIINRLKKGGTANTVLLAIAAVGAVLLALGFAIFAFIAASFFMASVAPATLMYIWDGAVVAFLFVWTLGVLIELQRSEPVSLQKFLHLPVSLGSAFFLNYLSSLLSFALLVFLPAAIGLIVGLAVSRGAMMLLLLAPLVALFYMVTALSYQFQGWLASMVANPRRRRTVIAFATLALILVSQLPNLLNVSQMGSRDRQNLELSKELHDSEAELARAEASGEISPEEHSQRFDELQRQFHARREQLRLGGRQRLESTFSLVNLVVPVGWLPLAARALAERNVLPAVAGTLGLFLIGTASMWRAYRSTLRVYTGQINARPRRRASASRDGKVSDAPVPPSVPAAAGEANFLEKQLPFVSEHASAIAVAGFRSLLRAPEAKLLLITPVIIVITFAVMARTQSRETPEIARPFMAFGGMGMVMLGLFQLVGNQFGFDRSGFRVFVLCPAHRRDILLGKNLSVAPFALIFALIVAIAVQVTTPMPLDYLLGILPTFIAMYLVFCIFANWLSILVPLPIAAGTLKPSNMKVVPALCHVAFVLLFFPLMAFLMSPIVAKLVLKELGYADYVPVCLLLSLVECALVVCLYRVVLGSQGRTLQAREKRILDVVTKTGV